MAEAELALLLAAREFNIEVIHMQHAAAVMLPIGMTPALLNPVTHSLVVAPILVPANLAVVTFAIQVAMSMRLLPVTPRLMHAIHVAYLLHIILVHVDPTSQADVQKLAAPRQHHPPAAARRAIPVRAVTAPALHPAEQEIKPAR